MFDIFSNVCIKIQDRRHIMKSKFTIPQWAIIFSLLLLFIAIFTPLSTPVFGTAGFIGTIIAWVLMIRSEKRDEEVIDVHFKVTDPKKSDFEEKLRKLENLRTDGLISDEEYEKKRKEIMNEKW